VVIAVNGKQAALLAPCLNGTSEFVYFPIARENGQCLGALLLFLKKPREYFSAHRNEVKLVAHKMRDILVIERLRQARPEPDNAAGRGGKLETLLELGQLEQAKTFINMMNFPMFIIQTDGELVAVNQSLLYRLKFSSLDDFTRRCDIFQDLFQHGEMLKTLTHEGGIRSRKLLLHDSTGERMTVTMSAVCMNEYIVGSLFDVSEYVRITDDLRESLKMQEFLNDKLISAALLLHKTQSSAIRSLARLAEFRDHETGDHLQRICEYSKLIAQEVFRRQPFSFKIRSEYCDDIFLSSMLHDIGKVGIPDYILLKKGKLDEDEWKIMRSHTVIGWTILNQADCELGEQSFLTLASQIALNHHERWDGMGYPYGLRDEKIPLSARISAVADVYDALTSQRPYKKAWHHDDAIREIKSKCDIAFDPVIVDILLSVEKKFVDIHYQFPK
jgi:response regulator RpfG family c-di-GMP phosphodiesterase